MHGVRRATSRRIAEETPLVPEGYEHSIPVHWSKVTAFGQRDPSDACSTAAVWKPSGALLESDRIVFVASTGDADTRQDIVPLPPRETRRQLVTTQGDVDFVHQVLIGHDSWMHDHWSLFDIFEQRFPDDPRGNYFGPPPARPAIDPAVEKDVWWVSDFAVHYRVRIHFHALLQADPAKSDYLSIGPDVRYEYLEDFLVDDNKRWHAPGPPGRRRAQSLRRRAHRRAARRIGRCLDRSEDGRRV